MLGATSSAVCTPHPLIGTVEGSNLQQNRNRNIGAWPWPASSSCAKRASSASGDLGPSVQPARFSVHSHPVGECLYFFLRCSTQAYPLERTCRVLSRCGLKVQEKARSQLSRRESVFDIKLLAWSRARGCPNPGDRTRDNSEQCATQQLRMMSPCKRNLLLQTPDYFTCFASSVIPVVPSHPPRPRLPP